MITWCVMHAIDVANVIALGMFTGMLIGGYYLYRERKEILGPKP